MDLLKFGRGNAKLDKRIWHFSLPAGRTCVGARNCHSWAVESGGSRVVKDGPHTTFRCFAASQEAMYTATYEARRHNLALLKKAKSTPAMITLIQRSLPPSATHLRIHVSGDFFSQSYFDAWMMVAKMNTSITFYAYTKSLPFWIKRLGDIPNNLILTASVGGRYDSEIPKHNLRYAIVTTEDEAKRHNLSIDKDDALAMSPGPSFALLLHGVQPKGSRAALEWAKLKKSGKSGYSRKKLVTL